MGADMFQYAERMFNAVSTFESLSTQKDVTDKLATILSSFGYSAFLITNVPEPPLRLEPYILLNGWPKGWSEHYSKSDYYKFDPVAAWCRKSIDPFEWSEVPYPRGMNSRAEEVMNVARDFGMIEGFLVPIVRSSGFHACVTMAGRSVDLDPSAKRVVHVISMFAHARISALGGNKAHGPVALTSTEREILSWTAAGKSSWEIAQILNIAKSTVDTLANRAAKKLDAVNRTQAVVNAIRGQHISV
jgi:LuxR family quorum sensing-dependent transcriptional regulator